MSPFNLAWSPWLRWVLVIPTMLGYYMATSLLVNLLFVMAGGDLKTGAHPGYWAGGHGEGLVYLLHDLLFSYASLISVYYGAKMAPKHCYRVMLTLGGLLSSALVGLIFFAGLYLSSEQMRESQFGLFSLGLFPVGFLVLSLSIRYQDYLGTLLNSQD